LVLLGKELEVERSLVLEEWLRAMGTVPAGRIMIVYSVWELILNSLRSH
jgi:hypothetical protein